MFHTRFWIGSTKRWNCISKALRFLQIKAEHQDCPPNPTLGARGFSCVVSGFGQVLTSDPREKFVLVASPLVSSACGQHPAKAPRRTQEKTSGAQGNLTLESNSSLCIWKNDTQRIVFLTNFGVFRLVMKNCVECLILLLKQNDFRGRN